jgi:hypothetical protein
MPCERINNISPGKLKHHQWGTLELAQETRAERAKTAFSGRLPAGK